MFLRLCISWSPWSAFLCRGYDAKSAWRNDAGHIRLLFCLQERFSSPVQNGFHTSMATNSAMHTYQYFWFLSFAVFVRQTRLDSCTFLILPHKHVWCCIWPLLLSCIHVCTFCKFYMRVVTCPSDWPNKIMTFGETFSALFTLSICIWTPFLAIGNTLRPRTQLVRLFGLQSALHLSPYSFA